MKTRIRSLRLEKLEDRQLLHGAGLGLDVVTPVGPPADLPDGPPDSVPVEIGPPVGVPDPAQGPDTIDHDSHGGFTGVTIQQGETQTVIGPHHTDEAGHDSDHFFAETGDDHHFAWADQDPSTAVIDIWYDFRDAGGRWGQNKITAGQTAMAELALDKWEVAAGGDTVIKFTQKTEAEAPDSQIINIGTGDLRALGYRSTPGGILGLGGGTYTHSSEHTITSGVAWMDSAENWDTQFDYFTVVAQEIGHALGLGHVTGGIMDGQYTGPVADYSATDASHIQAVYGEVGPVDDAPVVTIDSPANGAEFGNGQLIEFTASATDTEDDNAILTISTNWSWSVDGVPQAGADTASFSTDSLAHDSAHVITASVTDSDGNTSESSISITVGDLPEVATKVSVTSISYQLSGGKNNDRNLQITIELDDDFGDPVEGASVSIRLTSGNKTWIATGTTGADGTVAFQLNRAPKGTYSTEIVDVVAADLDSDGIPDLTWDEVQPSDPGITK